LSYRGIILNQIPITKSQIPNPKSQINPNYPMSK
jgi:hypothetical protein